MNRGDKVALAGLVGAGVGLLYFSRRADAANAEPAQGSAPLVAAVGAGLEVVALARILASEDARGTAAERVAIGWCARNRARKRGQTIEQMVCVPHCGPQSEAGGKMRPFSSARPPREADLELAKSVLAAPAWADPTEGATSCLVPELQDRLVTEGRPGYTRTYAEVRERWMKGGLKPIGRIGKWELWR
jgi:hypothetical protein